MPPLLKFNRQKRTMKKKIQIEYPLNPSSGSVIWGAISTPSGLERWFADDVRKEGKKFIFKWGKTESRDAEIINNRTESFIRFHWTDEEPRTYFEFKIHYNELTKDHSLEVIDFVDSTEEDDTRSLWNSQIDVLKRVFGI